MGKRKWVLLIGILAVLSFGIIAAVPLPAENITIDRPQQQQQQPCYIIKQYNGKVAVFKEGSNTPNQVFDVFVDTLPQVDAQALQSGILVTGDEDLKRLIEDYTS